MMRRLSFISTLLIMLAAATNAYATAQFSEVIYIDSTYFAMLTCPFEECPVGEELFSKYPPSDYACTALYRGYIGYWRLDKGVLYLDSMEIYANSKDITTIVAAEEPVFSRYLTENGVTASWFNGELRVVSGQRIFYQHDAFEQAYAKEDFYTMENGLCVSKKHYDQRKVTTGKLWKIIEAEQYIAERHPEYSFSVSGVTTLRPKRVDKDDIPTADIEYSLHCKQPGQQDSTLLNEVIHQFEEYLQGETLLDVYYIKGEYRSPIIWSIPIKFNRTDEQRRAAIGRMKSERGIPQE